MRTKLVLNPLTGELDQVTRIDSAQVTVDFGFSSAGEGCTATATVVAPWVQSSTTLICTPTAEPTVEHDSEDVAVEEIKAYAINIVSGVGFDIIAVAPNNTFGRYVISVIGV